jgi:chromate reductase, NAD(P)H dehydrogenase (quinone)
MKKNILIIIGSASQNSSNQKVVDYITAQYNQTYNFTIISDLKILPHFDADNTNSESPIEVTNFRKQVEIADGVIICTPEYIFSIPSGLKNALEWCVATIVFQHKPMGIITASADGQKGHDELQLIMKTLMAKFTNDTTLLIKGIKGKINEYGVIINQPTQNDLMKFMEGFSKLIDHT